MRVWIGLALLFTLLNVFKPLIIDDAAYFYYAEQMAENPGDPYGFDIFWYQKSVPAHEVVAPPLLPYWWAGAMTLFGENPLLWKLSLLPFALMLALSLHDLLRRFAPGLETPLICMAMLSPVLLPGFNLMLDVPSLALALTGLVIFMRACEEEDFRFALLAGCLAGLAMQTKYNAVLPLIAGLAYCGLHRRWRIGIVGGGIASLIFLGWEGFMALRYGESHFWLGLKGASDWPEQRWLLGSLCLLGSTAGATALLCQIALNARRALIYGTAAMILLAFAVLPLLEWTRRAKVSLPIDMGFPGPEQTIFAVLGAIVVTSVGLVARREWTACRAANGIFSGDGFLLVWLAIEIAGYFLLSPFLATRRVIGMSVVLLLLAGRAASHLKGSMRPIWGASCAGVLLGLLFCISDLSDAQARRHVLDNTEARLSDLGADRTRETVWFVGHWGFQHHAEQRGMSAAAVGESLLRQGDWLLVPQRVMHQQIALREGTTEVVGLVTSESSWPWSTIPSAYDGYVPIRGQLEYQVRVIVRRVRNDFIPELRFDTKQARR